MRIQSLTIQNFRSFSRLEELPLDKINVLIGPNNAGKSSLLRAVYTLQEGVGNLSPDIRLGSQSSHLEFVVADRHESERWDYQDGAHFRIKISASNPLLEIRTTHSSIDGAPLASQSEPQHVILPYLSMRKTLNYIEDVRLQHTNAILPNFSNLAAKLVRLGNPAFAAHRDYSRTCEDILGFVVTAIPSNSGQSPGVYFPDSIRSLPISQMGDGVPNIVGLLANLVLAKKKIFLIEEPENDLHPAALKSLLQLMIKSAENNQFIVSTHSNIVARILGGAPNSRLYHVTTAHGALPADTKVTQVDNDPMSRISVLNELGYSPEDFELWDGWLFLEEASAERIIRDYLVPWFVPKLTRIRTVSAGGADKVEPTFEDFRRFVLFMHLEPTYRKRSWIRVDGDDKGNALIERLRETYAEWESNRFRAFTQPQFERYYPELFRGRIEQVLSIRDHQELRIAKRELLHEVRTWLDENYERGRAALEVSAAEVIEDLKSMAAELT